MQFISFFTLGSLGSLFLILSSSVCCSIFSYCLVIPHAFFPFLCFPLFLLKFFLPLFKLTHPRLLILHSYFLSHQAFESLSAFFDVRLSGQPTGPTGTSRTTSSLSMRLHVTQLDVRFPRYLLSGVYIDYFLFPRLFLLLFILRNPIRNITIGVLCSSVLVPRSPTDPSEAIFRPPLLKRYPLD